MGLTRNMIKDTRTAVNRTRGTITRTRSIAKKVVKLAVVIEAARSLRRAVKAFRAAH
jgi:hypothetical protein